jgi:hypothetical protein
MKPTQCSETSAFNTQTPGKYPEDNSLLLQHGESLKSRSNILVDLFYVQIPPAVPKSGTQYGGNKVTGDDGNLSFKTRITGKYL